MEVIGLHDCFCYAVFAWKFAGGGRCARFYGRLAALDEIEGTCYKGVLTLYNGMHRMMLSGHLPVVTHHTWPGLFALL